MARSPVSSICKGFDDGFAGEDVAGSGGEGLEEGGFGAGEMDDAGGADELGAGDVEFERAEAEGGLGRLGGGGGVRRRSMARRRRTSS